MCGSCAGHYAEPSSPGLNKADAAAAGRASGHLVPVAGLPEPTPTGAAATTLLAAILSTVAVHTLAAIQEGSTASNALLAVLLPTAEPGARDLQDLKAWAVYSLTQVG